MKKYIRTAIVCATALVGISSTSQLYAQANATTNTQNGAFGLTTTPDFGLSGFGAGTQDSFRTTLGSTPTTATGRGGNALGGAFGSAFGAGFGAGGFGGGGFGGQNNQQTQSPIKVTLKLGFRPNLLSPTQVAQQLNSRLGRLPLPAKFSSLQIQINGRTATVSGQVPEQRDAGVIEQLLLMEPGIDDVVNQASWIKSDKEVNDALENDF